MFYSTAYFSPVGELTLVGSAEGEELVGLWIKGQKYFMATLSETPEVRDDLPVFHQARAWLDRYFAGERPPISELKLAPMGSGFRQEVWDILCEIPYGQTTTYGEIGRKIAARRGLEHMSCQAIGGAVSHNPISIIIPCHRVVGTHGSLTGYAGGIAKKIWLLEHEGVQTSGFYVPEKGTAL